MAKHYITVDKGIVIDGYSDEFKTPSDTDICINENGGRQFELLGEINPPLLNGDNCHRFRCDTITTEEKIQTSEDVTSDVTVDTSNITVEGGMTVENVSVSAVANGYFIDKHITYNVRYATADELAEELQNISIDKTLSSIDLQQEINADLDFRLCILELGL